MVQPAQNRHRQRATDGLNGTRDRRVLVQRQVRTALGQKIEAVEGIVPVRRSLVGRCAAIGLMQQRIADLPIFVLGCCELHSQKQAQLKVGAFEPQPSIYQN
jgi:hypothetical protein